MAQQTRAAIEVLGTTGEGIKRAADIDITQVNEFTTKWGAYFTSN